MVNMVVESRLTYANLSPWGIIPGMSGLTSAATLVKAHYWPLIKSRQTFLLTLTGAAGFLYQHRIVPDWVLFTGLLGSLLLTIGGCSVLNMLFDRDIDRLMQRTRQRPLADGRVNPRTGAILGTAMIAAGLLWASTLSWLYFTIILAGVVLNVLVYSLWLKRRTPWSILWGGVAGSMPILAGSVLAAARLDATGVLLGLVVLCWIPSHNLTLITLHPDDYIKAGVPNFLHAYGTGFTRLAIVLSSILTAALMLLAFARLEPPPLLMVLLGAGSATLIAMALLSWRDSTPGNVKLHYKFSSIYMLACMLLLSLSGLW
jgi:heme o synthase